MGEGCSQGVLAYIGLGSNLGNPVQQLRSARDAISTLPGTRQIACSRFYRSVPMGPTDQPDYVNAVMAICTSLEPMALLKALQGIEAQHGRVRTGLRWGPRTLDLDVLLYGDRRIAVDNLTVPHPGMGTREFVLYPLAEIAPADLEIPGMGSLAELVKSCPRRGLEVIDHA